eukprot:TRINITY_DN9689_c0_g1_i2.p1 TRINITY_DN9689_c0_g1~~TRINITY_DN9689_c0_g1_i2.p1  ORF type:complete len:232 (+),score=29.57 TRINITY_DN9689_c0_g1_i2:794-1489(+)
MDEPARARVDALAHSIHTIVPDLPTDMDRHQIVLLISKVKCNFFGLFTPDIIDRDKILWSGAGVFLRLSLFNHDCLPSCTVLQVGPRPGGAPDADRGTRFEVRALCNVEEGAELTISYIRLHTNTAERSKQLMTNWFFTCSCGRCSLPDSADPLVPSLCCRRDDVCHGGMLVPCDSSSTKEDGDDGDGDDAGECLDDDNKDVPSCNGFCRVCSDVGRMPLRTLAREGGTRA